jgi:hypothetical protein
VSPGSSFLQQLIQAGVGRRLCIFIGTHAAEYALSFCAWWLLGLAALNGSSRRAG